MAMVDSVTINAAKTNWLNRAIILFLSARGRRQIIQQQPRKRPLPTA